MFFLRFLDNFTSLESKSLLTENLLLKKTLAQLSASAAPLPNTSMGMGVEATQQGISPFKSNAMGVHVESSLNRFWFLHIPKTGTSFFRPLVAHACPWKNITEVDQLFHRISRGAPVEKCASNIEAGHPPLPRSADPSKYVTILRHPITRIASGFVHGFHDCQKMSSFNDGCKPVKDEIVLMYANCVTGCMTRMLNGIPCGGAHGSLPGRQKEGIAMDRLSKLAFVGFTDDWNDTINHFLHRFPTALQAHHFYENSRPTRNAECKRQVLDVLVRHNFSDEADMRVYTFGRKKYCFVNRGYSHWCRKH
jgi:hypothetical protein